MAFTPCKLAKGQDGDVADFIAKLQGFGHNDMCNMPVLTKEAILENLLKRFHGEVVYTYVGDIIVSLNPFKNVGCVGKAIRARYKQGGSRNLLPPHIYALVGQTYGQMMTESISQSILISGESGAGKTEAMKVCLTYIAELSKERKSGGGGDDVATRLMQTNPVMEAIGNAKTIRNNNSSRFGKHFDVQFDANGGIQGAHTSSYLLEKPRICMHMDGERNYHVFYMLCKAADDIRGPVFIEGWERYNICKQPGTVAEVTTWNDKAEFGDMHPALLKVGFSTDQRQMLYMMLSICLHIGNLNIVAEGQGSGVTNKDELGKTAEMFQVKPDELLIAITNRTMGGGRIETFLKPLEPKQADNARNSLCMHIYSLVFDWCVDVINEYISRPDSASFCVGILDIFGFENFSKNSFPQLCINLTNESLHNLFIEHVFKLEQETYIKEEVEWNFVEYEDNQHVLDLIQKRPVCVLGLLDEGCQMGSSTDAAILMNFHNTFKDPKLHKAYIRPLKSADKTFVLSHYAGDVVYTITGFVEKNKDELSTDIILLLTELSSFEELKTLAKRDEERKADAAAAKASSKKNKGGGNKKKTVSRSFGDSLTALMTKLRTTEHHYIRCLKPNQTLKAGDWDADFMFKQLAYSGTLEVTQIRKAGLNVRRPLKHFFTYYKICAEDASALRAPTLTERTKLLMVQLGMDQTKFRVGKTLLFLLNYELLDQLDKLREVKILEHVINLQSLMRMVREVLKYRLARRRIRRIQDYFHTRDVRMAYGEVKWASQVIARFARGSIVRRMISHMTTADTSREDLRTAVLAQLDKISGRTQNTAKPGAQDEQAHAQLRCKIVHEGWLRVGLPEALWDARQLHYVVVRHGVLSVYKFPGGDPLVSLQLAETELEAENCCMLLTMPDPFADSAATTAMAEVEAAAAEETAEILAAEAAEAAEEEANSHRNTRKTMIGGGKKKGGFSKGDAARLAEKAMENRDVAMEAQQAVAQSGPSVCQVILEVDDDDDHDGRGGEAAVAGRPLGISSVAVDHLTCQVSERTTTAALADAEDETHDHDRVSTPKNRTATWQKTVEEAISEARAVDACMLHVLAPEKTEDDEPGSSTGAEKAEVIKRGFLFCRRFRARVHIRSASSDAAESEDLVPIDPSWRKEYFVLYNDGRLHAYSDENMSHDRIQLDLRLYALRELDREMLAAQNIVEVDANLRYAQGLDVHERSLADGGAKSRKRRNSLVHLFGLKSKGKSEVGTPKRRWMQTHIENEFFHDGMPYMMQEQTQLELASGSRRLCIAAEQKVADDWLHILQLGTSRLYQKSPIFPQDRLKIETLNGKVLNVPVDDHTRAAAVARAACRTLGLQVGLWTLHEAWTFAGLPGGATERRVPDRERVLDELLLRWEGAERRQHGMVATPPERSFRLVLRKVASFGTAAAVLNGAELSHSFTQALHDVGTGVFQGSEQDTYDVCALSLYHAMKIPVDMAQRTSDMPAIVGGGHHDMGARASMARARKSIAGQMLNARATHVGRASVARQSLAANVRVECLEATSVVVGEETYTTVAAALVSGHPANTAVGQAARLNPALVDELPTVSPADLEGYERQLFPVQWFDPKRVTSATGATDESPSDKAKASEEELLRWRSGLCESFTALIKEPLEAEQQPSMLRRAVREVRMERDLTAADAGMIVVDTVRRDPLCFSSEYSVEMWSHNDTATIPVHLAINYAGLHIFSRDRTRCLFRFSMVTDLLAWVHLHDMLVVRFLRIDPGKETRRAKKVHFLSPDSADICALLTKYAEEVKLEQAKLTRERDAQWKRQRDVQRKKRLHSMMGRGSTMQRVRESVARGGGRSRVDHCPLVRVPVPVLALALVQAWPPSARTRRSRSELTAPALDKKASGSGIDRGSAANAPPPPPPPTAIDSFGEMAARQFTGGLEA